MKYECVCGYVYDPALGDPDNGVAPGTAWEVPLLFCCYLRSSDFLALNSSSVIAPQSNKSL